MMTVDFLDLGSPITYLNMVLNICNLIAIVWLMTHLSLKTVKKRKSERRDIT